MNNHTSRRELLGGAAAALVAANASFAAPVVNDDAGFKLGVASYSLRKLSRADAIKALDALKVRYINIKDFHAPMKSTPDELKQIRADFESAGIQILGVGNVSFARNDEGEMRRNFEYAKALGAPVIVMAPTHETVGFIEKLVKEYDIKAAIHNHGPEDKHFPAPADVLKAVKGMDQRMGLCIDVGHTTRTGTEIVSSIKEAGSRLHDMHVKDLANLMNKDSQVAVGDGAMPIPAIFRQLQKMGFKGGVMLEYEIMADNPLPGMHKSFSYMRGVLAGMKG
ncbi:MAG TPA: sugar phosphate isomerase/epimerase [Bryobacteraceae bacterium]|nr:sugar phosphate isomerase/epimerase [Bryobacteraceae bacterium]